MIDTNGMRDAASGDQTKKVAVSKAWLKAVAKEIDALRIEVKLYKAVGFGRS